MSLTSLKGVGPKTLALLNKLNINNEMLTLAKDLTIVYRIFTS